jgi:hypothetical protein
MQVMPVLEEHPQPSKAMHRLREGIAPGRSAVSCVSTQSTISGIIDMINRCAVEAGGTNWTANAMTGLAAVVIIVLLAGTIYTALHR